jgi:hypothetical protein
MLRSLFKNDEVNDGIIIIDNKNKISSLNEKLLTEIIYIILEYMDDYLLIKMNIISKRVREMSYKIMINRNMENGDYIIKYLINYETVIPKLEKDFGSKREDNLNVYKQHFSLLSIQIDKMFDIYDIGISSSFVSRYELIRGFF